MNDLPKRKQLRLKNYDYSKTGVYFITVCTKDRKPLLSRIKVESQVGEGLAPPVYKTELMPCGIIVKEQLLLLEQRYENVQIKSYVIMPDHIHALIFIKNIAGGASPSPTLNDVICAFKSIASRICTQRLGIKNLFQRSFSEHIIRDREDYLVRRKYIYDNPRRWYYNKRKPD